MVIKVLIADDHPIVRKGLRQLLLESNGNYLVDEAADGEEALRSVEENGYDVVLLDISMPVKDGLTALREIKEIRPQLPVIMLTIYSEDQYAVNAIKSGASGYLTKVSAPEKLIDAIEKVLSGERYVSAEVGRMLADELGGRVNQPIHKNLSSREFDVMIRIARGAIIRDIAEELSLSEKTISTYRKRVLKKMRLKGTADITRYVINAGLME